MTRNRALALLLTIALPVGIIAAGFLTNIVLGALKEKPEEAAEGPRGLPVFVDGMSRQDVSLTVASQGEVTPRREANLSAQISGKAVYVSPNLEDGGFVRRGEILMRIDDADYKLAMVRAESTVATARQSLALAEAEADNARKDWEEIGVGVPSPLALRQPQLEEARAGLAAAEAQAEDTALQLARTAVRAPFDGRVQSKMIEVGQYISPGVTIASVFSTDVVVVELQLSNDELADIGLSLAFTATADDPGPAVILSNRAGGVRNEWRGVIMRTGARVDSTTRLASVFVEVADPFGEGSDDGAPLAPGLFVNASIEGRMIENVLTAPRAALRSGDLVYVIEDAPPAGFEAADDLSEDEAYMHIRQVDVLRSTPESVYVRSGLDDDALVIVSPVQAAANGMRVLVVDGQGSRPTSDTGVIASAPGNSGAAQ
ncbi:MAG: efflux RND transporter periplasmic adaptor subunit [Pseudomonadota bacterium]